MSLNVSPKIMAAAGEIMTEINMAMSPRLQLEALARGLERERQKMAAEFKSEYLRSLPDRCAEIRRKR